MLDLIAELAEMTAGALTTEACAVATIVEASGSVPRPVGTSMLVSESGQVLGSLSGGCVEGAVFEACQDVLSSGVPRRESFGYSDDDAFAVGLTCGGSLELLIQPVYPPRDPRRSGAISGLHGPVPEPAVPAALVRRIDPGGGGGFLIPDARLLDPAALRVRLRDLLKEGTSPADERLVRNAADQLAALVCGGQTESIRLAHAPGTVGGPGAGTAEGTAGGDPDGLCGPAPITLFVESRRPAPRLFLFGANDFSAALMEAAKLLGYHVTLCDARPAFAVGPAYSRADVLEVAWPHRFLERCVREGLVDDRSAVCVLTHDAKFDIPLLLAALDLDLAYVGAMGSRRSDEQRRRTLRSHGVTETQLTRLHSPIGLDLGAVSPGEVAVAVAAELLAVSRGRSAPAPLSRGNSPIH